MAPRRARRGTRLGLILAVVLPALLAGGTVALVAGRDDPGIEGGGRSPAVLARLAEQVAAARPLRPTSAQPGSAALGPERLEPVAGGIRPARPVRISIPAAGIHARVRAVGERAGAIEVPAVGEAGWFDAGPRPGETGRAVVIGHLDTHHDPGVFARVPRVTPGTAVSVLDRRGDVHRFKVVGSAQVEKEHFPASDVYGASDAPVLVLITCGGRFTHGHYTDNVLVYARAA
jgi:sortase family protein